MPTTSRDLGVGVVVDFRRVELAGYRGGHASRAHVCLLVDLMLELKDVVWARSDVSYAAPCLGVIQTLGLLDLVLLQFLADLAQVVRLTLEVLDLVWLACLLRYAAGSGFQDLTWVHAARNRHRVDEHLDGLALLIHGHLVVVNYVRDDALGAVASAQLRAHLGRLCGSHVHLNVLALLSDSNDFAFVFAVPDKRAVVELVA